MAWLRKTPPGLSSSIHLFEKRRQHRFADVFQQADGGDAVETVGFANFPIIAEADLAAVLKAGLADASIGPLGLGRRNGDSHRLDAVMTSGVKDQTAPAATEIEQALAGL